MSAKAPSVSRTVAERYAALRADDLPALARERAADMLLDVAGLCIAARHADYVQALVASWDEPGRCTALGHAGSRGAAAAAMINGTAAHGEDFDDTFEGGPVHAGVVIVPAVLAACERDGRGGRSALLGIATGAETMCRLSLVAPQAVHRAGFHPTCVFGAIGSAVAVGTALGLDAGRLAHAIGIAGSMASGIIEYLADGAWTKRMHAGWAAQAGIRAASMAAHGFVGPDRVLEGTHGLFHGFARTTAGDYDALTRELGTRWIMQDIAFKPYACGTMIHPYIDCARALASQGVRDDDIVEIVCETAEGIVHRLWEPLADKRRPPNAYAAKFSVPIGIASAFDTGGAGLEAYGEQQVRDPRVLALASKVSYVVDPANPYPNGYTGHLRATLRDGRRVEAHQPHLRGGMHERLGPGELEAKFASNVAVGGWPPARGEALRRFAASAFDGPIDLAAFRA